MSVFPLSFTLFVPLLLHFYSSFRAMINFTSFSLSLLLCLFMSSPRWSIFICITFLKSEEAFQKYFQITLLSISESQSMFESYPNVTRIRRITVKLIYSFSRETVHVSFQYYMFCLVTGLGNQRKSNFDIYY